MGNAHFKENENSEIRQLACKVEGMGFSVNYSKPKNKWITITKVNGIACSDKNKEEIKDFLQGIVEGDTDMQVYSLPKTKSMRAYARGNKDEQERTYVKDDILDDVSDETMLTELKYHNFNLDNVKNSYFKAIVEWIDDYDMISDEGKELTLKNSIRLQTEGAFITKTRFEKFKNLMNRFAIMNAKVNGVY